MRPNGFSTPLQEISSICCLKKYSYRFYWGEVLSSYIAMVLGTVVLGPVIYQVASS